MLPVMAAPHSLLGLVPAVATGHEAGQGGHGEGRQLPVGG